MKFIVKPLADAEQSKRITLCALCSENPRFCNEV
jgi:hypothetical protein